MSNLREELADLEHRQWSHLADYLLNLSVEEFGKNMEKWHKQINTNYKNLSEKEKDADRIWADKVLRLFNHHIQNAQKRLKELFKRPSKHNCLSVNDLEIEIDKIFLEEFGDKFAKVESNEQEKNDEN